MITQEQNEIMNLYIVNKPNHLTHSMLDEHLISHLDQVKQTLSVLPQQNFQQRTIKTDKFTQGLANNLIDTIIETCALNHTTRTANSGDSVTS